MTVTKQELDKAIDKVVARNRRAGVQFSNLRFPPLIRSKGSPSGCPLTAPWRTGPERWRACAYRWIRLPVAQIIVDAADGGTWPKDSLHAHARRRLESELPGLGDQS